MNSEVDEVLNHTDKDRHNLVTQILHCVCMYVSRSSVSSPGVASLHIPACSSTSVHRGRRDDRAPVATETDRRPRPQPLHFLVLQRGTTLRCHKVHGPHSPSGTPGVANISHSVRLPISSAPQMAPYFRFITEKQSPSLKVSLLKAVRSMGLFLQVWSCRCVWVLFAVCSVLVRYFMVDKCCCLADVSWGAVSS